MNTIDTLIRKANRIGQFFEAMPDRNEGIEGIVDHIQKFWEPRMRTAILNFLSEHPDGRSSHAELSPIVLNAIESHRDRLSPSSTSGIKQDVIPSL